MAPGTCQAIRASCVTAAPGRASISVETSSGAVRAVHSAPPSQASAIGDVVNWASSGAEVTAAVSAASAQPSVVPATTASSSGPAATGPRPSPAAAMPNSSKICAAVSAADGASTPARIAASEAPLARSRRRTDWRRRAASVVVPET
ncbi:hypothetical protein GCM10023107_06450 [Actinoplanes octamycinicus]|uniref:hypothetical protein n=1 Tax=Actinoplanes octamycinicus TaxID=135948 RepID=UPI0031E524CC